MKKKNMWRNLNIGRLTQKPLETLKFVFLGYVWGIIGWDIWSKGTLGNFMVQNTRSFGIVAWMIAGVMVGLAMVLAKDKVKDSEKKVKIIMVLGLVLVLLPLVEINIEPDNYFYFIRLIQENSGGLMAGGWAWMTSLIIFWFLGGLGRIGKFIETRRAMLILIVIFVGFYAVRNFYLYNNFILNAFDFGIYDHTLWRLAYDFSPSNSVNGFGNSFGAHFQPILFFLAPFYWLWNSPKMLLVLQILIIGSGAIPTFRLAMRKLNDRFVAWCLVFAYLFFVGNGAALSFPFHPSDVIAPALLFAYDYLDQGKIKWHIVFIFVTLFAKENAGLYVAGFGIWMILFKREYWKLGVAYLFGGVIWTGLATKIVLTAISGQRYRYFYYTGLGENMVKAMITLVTNPVYVLRLLMSNALKVNSLLTNLGTNGFISLGSNQLLLMAPSLGERLLSGKTTMNSLNGQYGAPMSFGVMVSTIEAIRYLKLRFTKNIIFQDKMWYKIAAVILVIGALWGQWDNRYFNSAWPLGRIWPYSYKTEVAEAIKLIPKDASVSAQTAILPHLGHRKEIFRYPTAVSGVDYIILSTEGHMGSKIRADYPNIIKKLLDNKKWGLIYSKGGVMVWQRGVKDKVGVSKEVREYLKGAK